MLVNLAAFAARFGRGASSAMDCRCLCLRSTPAHCICRITSDASPPVMKTV